MAGRAPRLLYRVGASPLTPSLPEAKCEALAFILSSEWASSSSCRARVTYRMFYAVATSGESESRSFTFPSSGSARSGLQIPHRRTSPATVELLMPDHPDLIPVFASLHSYGAPTYGRLSVDASCQRYSAPLAGLGTSLHTQSFLLTCECVWSGKIYRRRSILAGHAWDQVIVKALASLPDLARSIWALLAGRSSLLRHHHAYLSAVRFEVLSDFSDCRNYNI